MNLLLEKFQPQIAIPDEVILGLTSPHKMLPTHLLYDAEGSELFDRICQTEDYYLTRTEESILRTNAPDIADAFGAHAEIIELGSGSARKIRILLSELGQGVKYLPVEISGDALWKSVSELSEEFPNLEIQPHQMDFDAALIDPQLRPKGHSRVLFFPGSTIGNFSLKSACDLLRRAKALVGKEGLMLVGVDLKKDPEILDLAYNDREGVTARFELNILKRLNREWGANFDLDAFRYHGFYNHAAGRVEMYLVSLRAQSAYVGGFTIHFEEGESIHLENSYKYTVEEFQYLAGVAGLAPLAVWTDSKRWFSVHLFELNY